MASHENAHPVCATCGAELPVAFLISESISPSSPAPVFALDHRDYTIGRDNARDIVVNSTGRGDDSRGQTAASGVYFCVFEAAGQRETRKIVLLK